MKTLNNLDACMLCGGTLAMASFRESVLIEGHRFESSFDGMRCAACGQNFMEGTDMERFEQLAREMLAAGVPLQEPQPIDLAPHNR
jgi:uncharacterized protein with PIN domain